MGFISQKKVVLALALFLATAPRLNAQDQPTFRVETDLVLVDLLIEDSSGNPVTDLRMDEVTVLEGGKKRPLEYFEHVSLLAGGAEDSVTPGRANESPTIPVGPAQQVRTRSVPIIFVLDMNTIDTEELQRARAALAQFMAEIQGSPPPMMLFSIDTGLKLRQGITQDPGEILSALDAIRSGRTPISFKILIERIAGIYRALYYRDPKLAMDQSLSEAKMFLVDIRDRIASTSRALESLGEYVRPLAGRKSIVFYSTGYPLDAGGTVYDIMKEFNAFRTNQIADPHILSAKLEYSLGANQMDLVGKAIKQLNSGQVSVYSVDVRGLESETLNASREFEFIPQTLVMRRNSEDIVAPQRFLVALADDTGGLAAINTNALQLGAEKALADSSSYYILGFIPSKRGASERYAEIQVRVNRPNTRVRSRKGFLIPPKNTDEDETLVSAFRFPEVYHDFKISPDVQAGPETVGVRVQLPTSALRFDSRNGQHACLLTLYGGLRDQDGEWITEGKKKFAFAKEFRLQLTDQKKAALLANAFVTLEARTQVKAGTYDLTVIVRQQPTEVLATFQQTLTVPAP